MPAFRNEKWLLFFYSVPSKPVNARMKIWRRLAKAGAVQLKGSVYVLPYNEEHVELCQWLISEVMTMRGEGAFVKVEKVETMKDKEIIELFNKQRGKDYSEIEKSLDEFERKINSIRKGGSIQDARRLSGQFNRLIKEFEDIEKIDFFSAKTGADLKKRTEVLQRQIKGLSRSPAKPTSAVVSRNIKDYQGKTWVTRRKPFVDRMASAWLIKRFIDKKAHFDFIGEQEVEGLNENSIAFDIRDGEFTHQGDLCTFEVIVRAFGFKEKVLKKIAEIVHELDIKDEKFKNPEAKGIEDILLGIRKTSKDDKEILESGMALFEMLYASKK